MTITDLPILWLICCLIALQVVDGVTTVVALSRPGAREGNGVMAAIMRRIGVVPTMLLTKGAVSVLVWMYGALVGHWALAILIAVYAVVGVNNVRVIRAVRRREGGAQIQRDGGSGEER